MPSDNNSIGESAISPNPNFNYGENFISNDHARISRGNITAKEQISPYTHLSNADDTIKDKAETALPDQPILPPANLAQMEVWLKDLLANLKKNSAAGEEGEVTFSAAAGTTAATAQKPLNLTDKEMTEIDAILTAIGIDPNDQTQLPANKWLSNPSTALRIYLLLAELSVVRQEVIGLQSQMLVKGMQSSLDFSKSIAALTLEIGKLQVEEAKAQMVAAYAELAAGVVKMAGAIVGAGAGFIAGKASKTAQDRPEQDKHGKYSTGRLGGTDAANTQHITKKMVFDGQKADFTNGAISGTTTGLSQSLSAAGNIYQQSVFVRTKEEMAEAEAAKAMAEGAKNVQDTINREISDDLKATIDSAQAIASLLQAIIQNLQTRLSQAPSGT